MDDLQKKKQSLDRKWEMGNVYQGDHPEHLHANGISKFPSIQLVFILSTRNNSRNKNQSKKVFKKRTNCCGAYQSISREIRQTSNVNIAQMSNNSGKDRDGERDMDRDRSLRLFVRFLPHRHRPSVWLKKYYKGNTMPSLPLLIERVTSRPVIAYLSISSVFLLKFVCLQLPLFFSPPSLSVV